MVFDHMDENKINNFSTNLRLLDNETNLTRSMKLAKSGLRGVTKVFKKWRADISINGRMKYLGTFESKEDAYGAYLQAKGLC